MRAAAARAVIIIKNSHHFKILRHALRAALGRARPAHRFSGPPPKVPDGAVPGVRGILAAGMSPDGVRHGGALLLAAAGLAQKIANLRVGRGFSRFSWIFDRAVTFEVLRTTRGGALSTSSSGRDDNVKRPPRPGARGVFALLLLCLLVTFFFRKNISYGCT